MAISPRRSIAMTPPFAAQRGKFLEYDLAHCRHEMRLPKRIRAQMS
jgi:hypothetical protein